MLAPGTPYSIEVNPRVPEGLARLEELADNLWYSWDRPTRELFERLQPALWTAVGQSPKAFLKRIDERRLIEAVADPVFLSNFNRVLAAYDAYHAEVQHNHAGEPLHADDLIAYFCAEFGLHESLPIYSGGLGILAGDHCKAASDMRLPFVAVGLLYRQGYFVQSIDSEGNQHATYTDSDFTELPVALVRNADGTEARVAVELPGRALSVRIWRARAGHVWLYLLDTDVTENRERDRSITYRLYGGDRTVRLEQEIVLGIGGVRALAAMGHEPTVWHMNEGHAAFMVLERIRLLTRQDLNFASALEAVAADTVFTTHTAVPAGHDHFDQEVIATYFDAYCKEVGIGIDSFLALGHIPASADFDMTALAVRGTRFHNGVSRIHGGVTSRMLQDFWPQVPFLENPIEYVTNGVHIPTFLAREWHDVFDRFLGPAWTRRLRDRATWEAFDELPDHIFWSVHQYLKSQMLRLVRRRVRDQHFRNGGSEAHLDRILRHADPESPNVLTIGFGRRFATYKRATLLFEDIAWLKQIVSDPQRPVLFIFSGRAHPADVPGQDLIRQLTAISRMPEFEGKVLLVEDYDLRRARWLVAGVDVWLNNPIYPLEASGTSGMKAGMNGVINLSVLDGWWGEAYEGDNGWAIKPAAESLDQARRNREESRALYEILQDQVIPLYYQRGSQGYSAEWIQMAKRSIATILPRFNAERMVAEYRSKFYLPGMRQHRRYADRHGDTAKMIAAWKARARAAWPGVTLQRLDRPVPRLTFGASMRVEVGIKLNGLEPADVVVELLLARLIHETDRGKRQRHALVPDGIPNDAGEQRYVLDLAPDLCGRLDYRIRAYPFHERLAHPFELGLMLWA